MNPFYVTTPLYYINGSPHIGTIYSTLLADVLNRYHKLSDCETFFMTGTDEHGQKCMESAKKQGLPPSLYCNRMALRFEKTWKSLHIAPDFFFRTTLPWHKKAVQDSLQALYDKKLIYEGWYEGWYCVSEESFYKEKDLVEGQSPYGKKVTPIREKNYFFKMSLFQEDLIKHIHQNPSFIRPEAKRKEVLGFLQKPLSDLCLSRPVKRMSWGIPLPFDKNFVTYVWVDALLNYATGVGYRQEGRQAEFEKWWKGAGATHIIGKDILITHAVYWPCLLMALGLRLPQTIVAHGWILTPDQEKVSKSKGDRADEWIQKFPTDGLRYFLMKDVPVVKDSPFSKELMTKRWNEDLSNNFGNLFRRVSTLLRGHFHSRVPPPVFTDGGTGLKALPPFGSSLTPQQMDHLKSLKEDGLQTLKEVKNEVQEFQIHTALQKIVRLLNHTNKCLETEAPWKLASTHPQAAQAVLRQALEMICLCAVLLRPVMPSTMDKVLKNLSCPGEKWPLNSLQTGEFPKAGTPIAELPPLFPRIKNSEPLK